MSFYVRGQIVPSEVVSRVYQGPDSALYYGRWMYDNSIKYIKLYLFS